MLNNFKQTFAASLAAFYQKIPVAHVEAGLRTYNLRSPFPEELNRQLTSRIADFHFAPTEEAKLNLLQEGYLEKGILSIENHLHELAKYQSFLCLIFLFQK